MLTNFLKVVLGPFILQGLVLGCVDHHTQLEEHFEEMKVLDFPSEVRLPTLLWDLLEQKKIIDPLGKAILNPEKSKIFEENVFVGLTLKLSEKTPGILGGRNIAINGARAGLLVDLAAYLKKDRGTFYFSFEPNSKIDPSTAQVFFMSSSIKRNVEGQSLGTGCNQFYDVTQSYLNQLRESGIPVNVTEGRHVSLLAGTFFVRVSQSPGVRNLSQLTLTDTRYPDLLCDRNGEKSKE